MVIVIPCFNEPALLRSLESLWRCERPQRAVEVIVVVNSGENASAEVLEQNRRTLEEASFWSREDCDRYFRIHLIDAQNLPRKHAGVGLARKIGMDEALDRLGRLGRLQAPILCFDADSECDASYLAKVAEFFERHPKSPGCSIYFEHPLSGSEHPEVYDAITLYELHLRYYVEALRFAGFPFAFHTIGSSMAVRAEAYMNQGGMNRRQAGEDFYFLHKIITLGHFGEVNSTRVVPSPRASNRVPFGTGRAVSEYLAAGTIQTYPLAAFRDLKTLFETIPDLRETSAALARLPNTVQAFLAEQNGPAALEEIRAQTTTAEKFRKRFLRWFDGFRAMKYIHFARDSTYGATDVASAAAELLQDQERAPRELLLRYRRIQREGWRIPKGDAISSAS